MRRRQFNFGAFGAVLAAAAPFRAGEARSGGVAALYHVSVGRTLHSYHVDAARGRLVPAADPVSTPEEVQFAWPHPTRNLLYAASSDRSTTGLNRHFLSAFSVDERGGLTQLGDPWPLPARPIHLTVDPAGRYVLVAYNLPSSVSVHAIANDGRVGEPILQKAQLEMGVYAHQIRVFPSGRTVLVPARGNDTARSGAEAPGSLRVLAFEDGQLSNAQTLAPGGGLGFRPRHADFHPSGRWVYVGLESQNVVQTYAIVEDRLSNAPLFTSSTLDPARRARPGQILSAVRLHPDGRHLYIANRGTAVEPFKGQPVVNGENTIAVFVVDQRTGEPRAIQRVETQGVHARAMDLSRDGQWLVAGSIRPALIRFGDGVKSMPGGLSLFRIRAEGRLRLVQKLDLDTGRDAILWVGAWR